MANILDQYKEKQQEYNKQVDESALPLTSIIVLQELSYRIAVLENFRMLCITAPVTLNKREMGYHYQIADARIRALLSEQRFGPKVDAEGEKRRETALDALGRVIADVRKRFSNFNASTKERYKQNFGSLVQTVLSVWLKYRDTYVQV